MASNNQNEDEEDFHFSDFENEDFLDEMFYKPSQDLFQEEDKNHLKSSREADFIEDETKSNFESFREDKNYLKRQRETNFIEDKTEITFESLVHPKKKPKRPLYLQDYNFSPSKIYNENIIDISYQENIYNNIQNENYFDDDDNILSSNSQAFSFQQNSMNDFTIKDVDISPHRKGDFNPQNFPNSAFSFGKTNFLLDSNSSYITLFSLRNTLYKSMSENNITLKADNLKDLPYDSTLSTLSTIPSSEQQLIRAVGYAKDDRTLYLHRLSDEKIKILRQNLMNIELCKINQMNNFSDILKQIEEESSENQNTIINNIVSNENINNFDDKIYNNIEDQNWVDKYKPKYFSDLLLDEKTKLEVLKWLKGWDNLVFKQSKRSIKQESVKDNTAAQPIDALGNQPRVLLLGGPPGVGKTTLVEVLAKHCGYEILEINVSDERTKDKLIPILNGVVGTAGVGINKFTINTSINHESINKQTNFTQRATLCLLDEIDGITFQQHSEKQENKDAASALVELIDKKDSKGKPIIKRPIVCVCNDLWGRNLKGLRSKAKVIYIQSASEELLYDRLNFILKKEKFTFEANFISKLIKLHNTDIRSSVTALQLITRGKKKVKKITSEDLLTYSSFKDKEENKTYLIDLIFSDIKSFCSINSSRSYQFNLIFNSVMTNTASNSNQSLISLFQENFTQAAYTDAKMIKTSYLVDLLCFYDCLCSFTSGLFSVDLTTFNTLSPILFAAMFCGGNHSNIRKWKLFSSDLMCVKQRFLRSQTHYEIVKQAVPNISPYILKSTFLTEIAPTLITLILQHNSLHYKLWYKPQAILQNSFGYTHKDCVIGPIQPIQQISTKLIYQVNSLISFVKIFGLMFCYGLSFSQTINKHTLQQKEIKLHIDPSVILFNIKSTYSLDPPIHLFNTFDCSLNQHLLSSYTHKNNNYEHNNLINNYKKMSCYSHPMLHWNDNLSKSFLEAQQSTNKILTQSITQTIHKILSRGLNESLTSEIYCSTNIKLSSHTKENMNDNVKTQYNKYMQSSIFKNNFSEVLSSIPFKNLIQMERIFAQQLQNTPLYSSYIKTSKIDEHSKTLLNLPTYGYLRYEKGRCNAVKQPLTLEF